MPISYEKPTYEKIFHDFSYGRHCMVLGSTESGKTSFLLWFFLNCPMHLIIFNPIRHIEFEKICDIIVDENHVFNEDFNSKVINKHNKICITPSEKILGNRKMMTQLWNVLCMKVFKHEDSEFTRWAIKKGHIKDKDFRRQALLVLFNDELMDVVDMEELSNYHYDIIHAGQNYGISHIGNTQRHQNISKLITTQSKIKIVFDLDRRDIHVLKDTVEGIEYIKFLKPFHFMVIKGKRADGDYEIKFYQPVPLLKQGLRNNFFKEQAELAPTQSKQKFTLRKEMNE